MHKTNNKIELLYLGRKYPLQVQLKQEAIIEFTDKFYIAHSGFKNLERYLTSWYKLEARKLIQIRLNYFASNSGLTYNTMSIADTRSRWGSCNKKGDLRFNWRLIMSPQPVIDYVISHELAHLTEMNHSRQFWEKVRKMFPLYRQYRTWLKRNGEALKFNV